MTSEFQDVADALAYTTELREISGLLAQSPDGPLRWKQYRLTACADYFAATLSAQDAEIARLKGEVEKLRRKLAIADPDMPYPDDLSKQAGKPVSMLASIAAAIQTEGGK